VPVKNGAIPEAPEGGQSSQDGTLPERAAVPGAEEPPDPDCPDDGPAAVVDAAEATPAPEPTPTETPAAEIARTGSTVRRHRSPGQCHCAVWVVRPMPATPEIWATAVSPSTTENSNAM
jgi:hypothetical protein